MAGSDSQYLIHIFIDGRRRDRIGEPCHSLPHDHSSTFVPQPFSPARLIFTGIALLLGVSLSQSSLSSIMISSSQTVRDVVASHDMLIHLFERVHFFLQRLTNYAGIPLTEALTELLGKIMAQLLSLLALSTQTLADRRISRSSFHFPYAFLLTMAQKRL